VRPTTIDIRTRPLAVARAVSALLASGPLGRRQIEAVARIIAYTPVGIEDLYKLDGPTQWSSGRRPWSCCVVRPISVWTCGWIRKTARVLGEIVGELVDEPKHKAGQVLTSQDHQDGHVAQEVIVPPARVLRAQTAHDIKGESRGAVLVVLDRLRSANRGAQSPLWSQPLLGETVHVRERRGAAVAFVALTRARRHCVLGLPDNCGADVRPRVARRACDRPHRDLLSCLDEYGGAETDRPASRGYGGALVPPRAEGRRTTRVWRGAGQWRSKRSGLAFVLARCPAPRAVAPTGPSIGYQRLWAVRWRSGSGAAATRDGARVPGWGR